MSKKEIHKSKYASVYEWKDAKPEDFQYSKEQGFLDRICEHYGWDKYKEK